MAISLVLENLVGSFMSLQDPVSNLLTIIRNGYLARKEFVFDRSSKLKIKIINLLVENNFLGKFEIINLDSNKINLKIYLRYCGRKNYPIIRRIDRISKPGLRIYKSYKKLPKSTFGIYLMSTSFGVMTNREAIKRRIGGEIICVVE